MREGLLSFSLIFPHKDQPASCLVACELEPLRPHPALAPPSDKVDEKLDHTSYFPLPPSLLSLLPSFIHPGIHRSHKDLAHISHLSHT